MIPAAAPAAGISTRASVPTNFRAICDPMSPRKKKFPPNATADDERATAQKDKKTNCLPTFTPSPRATSYPMLITFRVIPPRNANKPNTAIHIANTVTYFQSVPIKII